MHAVFQDLRSALRSLRKGFLVTFLATVSLALAIGGNITVFSLINGLFFRPLPYPEARRLVLVGERFQDDTNIFSTVAAANFLDLRSQNGVFEDMAAFRGRSLQLTGGDKPEAVSGAAVTPSFFSVLGRSAAYGRVFAAEESSPGRDRVVLLSHAFWQSRFGGSPDAVGQDLAIDGQVYPVIGILPEDFEFLNPSTQLWIPLVLEPETVTRKKKDLLAVARLKPGVSMADVRGAMGALGKRLQEDFPDENRNYQMAVVNLREDIPDAQNRRVFGLMQGAMVFVLLIACANIANLLLARSYERESEIAIRSIMGAVRWKIMRQLLTESLVLAGLGSLVGLALGAMAIKVITTAMAAALPSFFAPTIDLKVIGFTIMIAVFAGLLFGIAPALSIRPNLYEVLKVRGTGASGNRRLVIRAFVVAEIALAMILLGGASMLIWGFLEVQYADPGFDAEDLLTAQVNLPDSRYQENQGVLTFYSTLLERLENLPGVTGVTLSSTLPRSPAQPKEQFTIDGNPLTAGQQPPRAIWLTAAPSYLATLKISMVRGRFFDRTDREDTPRVAAVSDSLARRYWPGEDPVGRSLTIREQSRRVVGVVADVQQEIPFGQEGTRLVVYLPAAQNPIPQMSVILRPSSGSQSLGGAMRNAIREIDAELPAPRILTLKQYLAQFLVGAQIFSVLLGGFGSLALLLAVIGTYGIVAYSVAQQTREIGVRMALGAQSTQVLRMVAVQGLKLAAIGLVIGVPGVLGLSRVVRSALAGVATVSPLTVILAAGVLAVSIILACLVPANRAARIDPMTVLRNN